MGWTGKSFLNSVPLGGKVKFLNKYEKSINRNGIDFDGCRVHVKNCEWTRSPSKNGTGKNVWTETFQVSGDAMVPNFHDQEFIIIDRLADVFERGDVIVFKYPKDPKKFFIKRIIGLPGETIKINDNHVYINDKLLEESGYLAPTVVTYWDKGNITLKSDEYFVLGDNRIASSDSRIWGPLQKKFIFGKYIEKKSNQ